MKFSKLAPKILLIEATGINIGSLKQKFAKSTSEKFELIHVKLWQDGINYLEQNPIDVILLDFALFKICLLNDFSKIKKILEKFPVIILIEQENQKTYLETLPLNIQDYLFKIDLFDENLLIKTIGYAIERQELIQQLHQNQISCYNEEIFQILTKTAPVLIWITNTQGEWIFCNQFCLDFLGIELSEKLINDWRLYVHPDDQILYHQAYQSAQTNHHNFQIEYRLLRFDGKYCWILNHTVPRFDLHNKFIGFVSSGIDITQRKLEEKLLVEKAHRDRTLTKITQQIHASLDLETILQTAIQAINQIFLAKKILIAKVTSPRQVKILFEAVNLEKGSSCDLLTSKKESIIDLDINWEKLQRGEIVIVENFPSKRLNSELQLECQSCTLLNIPLIAEKKLWGLLSLQECLTFEQWQTSNIETLQQIALHLAIAIQQSELYQQLAQANRELEQLAVVDSLTGIANRRKFDEYLANEWLRSTREQSPLALILCDLDHFKLYNDTYGHQAGDRCLYQVAQAVSKTIKRPADLAARYGGEELAVILPNTTLEGAAIVANQICLQIKALAIPHINSPIDLYVTLSVGVAGCIPSQESGAKFLIKTADQALYQAKQLGRNRIVQATTDADISAKF